MYYIIYIRIICQPCYRVSNKSSDKYYAAMTNSPTFQQNITELYLEQSWLYAKLKITKKHEIHRRINLIRIESKPVALMSKLQKNYKTKHQETTVEEEPETSRAQNTCEILGTAHHYCGVMNGAWAHACRQGTANVIRRRSVRGGHCD
jgi:hypothetical protein